MKLVKASVFNVSIILLIALMVSCGTEDSDPAPVDPCLTDPCGGSCPSACPPISGNLTRDDVKPEGDVTPTDDGYLVDGSLTMDFDSAGTVVFKNADVAVVFDENDRMTGMTGSVEIPAMSNYFSFEQPVQADVGFFTGKFLNDNRDFEILLQDEVYYFVFNIEVNIELKIGAVDDPEATQPLSIKSPAGGSITLIMDFSDPLFFYSVGGLDEEEKTGDDGKSRLLGVSFGASYRGNLIYRPENPVDEIVSFKARMVRGGSLSFWKILEGNAMFYQNADFGVDFNLKEPLASGVNAGYYAGWNGSVGLSLPVTSFASFDIPIGQGSAAITADGNTATGITARAFLKGIVEPDNTWWPDFVPIDWGTNLEAYGYVEETGRFDVGMSGEFTTRLASVTHGINGDLRFTNEAVTLQGQLTVNDELRTGRAIITKDSTTFLASQPDNFSEGIQETVTAQIDSAFAATERALADLEQASENYEFELSLRGFREALPPIIDRSHEIINDAVAAGIANGRAQANKILSDNDRALCSDNISSVVNAVAKPYRDALNRLRNAVANSQDTEQTRTELENALRAMAALNKIDKTVQVKIVHGNKAFIIPACTQKSTAYRSVRITATVLTQEQVNQINEAADNVKYIRETSDILINAQQIVDEMPSQEELEAMRSRVQGCVNELTENIGESGMTIYHEGGKITYFIMINGQRREADEYDIFDKNAVIAVARPNVEACR